MSDSIKPNPADSCCHRLLRELTWSALTLAGSIAPLLAVLASGYSLAWRDTSQLFVPMRTLIIWCRCGSAKWRPPSMRSGRQVTGCGAVLA